MADEKPKFSLDTLDLGPPEPAKTRDFSLDTLDTSDGAARERAPLENAPDDNWLTSTAKAVPTTIIKGLSHIPGQIGDIREGGRYLARRAIGAFTGETPEQLEAKGAKLRQRAQAESPIVAKALSIIPDTGVMPTGHDISAPILKQTGEYTPTSTLGRHAMEAGEAGLSMIGPVGGIKGAATKGAGLTTTPNVKLAQSVLKQSATPTAIGIGAAGGATASAVTDATKDPLYGMLAAPFGAGAAGLVEQAARARAPIPTDAASRRRAAPEFAKSVGDREKVLNAPETNPLGTKMTTAEASGDIPLARAEAALEGTDKDFAARLHSMRGENAAIRQQHMQTFADPAANPMAIADAYVQHLSDLHGQQAALVRDTMAPHEAAVTAAERQAGAAPQPRAVDRSTTGDLARDIAAEGNAAVGAEVTRLYNAVNPDRNLNVVTQGSASGARQMLEDFNPAVQTKSPGHEYVEMVAKLPDVLPFHDLVKLDQTLTGAMADFKNTNRAAHGQVSALKDLVQQDLRNALENQIAWEQRAVQNGTMAAEDTIGARLAAEARAYQENARRGARTGTGDDAAVGTTGVSSTTGEVGGRGVPAGGEGVPNFTAEDLARYNEAKQRHIDRVEGWRSGPVGDALKTSGFAGDYKLPGSKVAASIFKKGDAGGEHINAWLKGSNGDPQMLGIIQDLASTSLAEAAQKAGGLTPDVLAKWRQEYGPALSRLDQEVPNFSTRFDSTAAAEQALAEATAAREAARKQVETTSAKTLRDEEREAARFTNRDSTEDMRRGVGRVLSSDNSATQIGKILDDIGSNPAAVDGLRKAAADWMVDNFASTVSESGARNVQPKMSKFIAGREDTLRRLYGDEGLKNIQLLAEDLDRGAAHVAARMSPGSPTSSNLSGFMEGLAKHATSDRTWGALTSVVGFHALQTMSWSSLLGTASLLMDRFVGGELRDRSAAKVRKIISDAMADPEKGKLLLQHAIDNEGRPNMAALAPFLAPIKGEQPDDDRAKPSVRPGRASGGRIGAIDHAAEAAKYIRLAAKAKNDHGKTTESFLKVPDATIAKALAIAHEAI